MFFLFALCGVVLAQNATKPPGGSSAAKDSALGGVPTSFTLEPGPIGADYNPMEGGTKVDYFSQAVPIVQDGLLSGGDPAYPCFGTFRGRSPAQKYTLMTSHICNVKGVIAYNYSNGPEFHKDIPLTKVDPTMRPTIVDARVRRHPIELVRVSRVKRQMNGTIRAVTSPFVIDLYAFNYLDRPNDTVFTGADAIESKPEYISLMRWPQARGIVLASRPYKAAAVSLDQSNCTYWYNFRAQWDYPEELPAGVFCVFKGTGPIWISSGKRIAPGVPCADSLGSPVLVKGASGSYMVLGVVIDFLCDWTPPEWGHIPKFALATSVAYGFDYVEVPFTTPEPSPSFYTFPPRSGLQTTVGSLIPYGSSSLLAVNRVLVLSATITGLYITSRLLQ